MSIRKIDIPRGSNHVKSGTTIIDYDGNNYLPATVSTGDSYIVQKETTFALPIHGVADKATALTSSAGSATQPIYFDEGKPTASTVRVGSARHPVYLKAGVLTPIAPSEYTSAWDNADIYWRGSGDDFYYTSGVSVNPKTKGIICNNVDCKTVVCNSINGSVIKTLPSSIIANQNINYWEKILTVTFSKSWRAQNFHFYLYDTINFTNFAEVYIKLRSRENEQTIDKNIAIGGRGSLSDFCTVQKENVLEFWAKIKSGDYTNLTVSLLNITSENEGAEYNWTRLRSATKPDGAVDADSYLHYNSYKADRLITSRKLWGNDFNGSANIDGTIKFAPGSRSRNIWVDGAGIKVIAPTSSSFAMGLNLHDNTGATSLGGAIGFYGNMDNAAGYVYSYIGDAYNSNNLRVYAGGNVTIGGSSAPSEKLFINGTLRAFDTRLDHIRTDYGVAYSWTDVWKGTDNINRPNYGLYFGAPNSSDPYGVTLSGNFGVSIHTANGTVKVNQNGNVGIGTTSPAYKLDVTGMGRFTDKVLGQKGFYLNNSSGSVGYFLYSTVEPTTYGLIMSPTESLGKHGSVTGSWATYLCMSTNTSSEVRGWIFRNSYSSKNVASIDTSGNAVFGNIKGSNGILNNLAVGYSAIDSNYTIKCGGRFYADDDSQIYGSLTVGSLYSETDIYAVTGIHSDGYVSALGSNSSDIRLKKNIKKFKGLELLNKLDFVSYNWNEKAKQIASVYNDGINYGIIAQKSENVIADLVYQMPNSKYKGVRYEKLIPILGQCIKEQQKELVKQANKISNLEKEIQQLKELIYGGKFKASV